MMDGACRPVDGEGGGRKSQISIHNPCSVIHDPIFIKSSAQIVDNRCAEETEMQTELFEWSAKSLPEEPVVPKSSFLERTSFDLRLDQILGIALVLLVFYVLVFSWGVDRGKRSAFESHALKTVAASIAPEISSATVAVAKVAEKEPSVIAPNSSDSIGKVPQEVPIPSSELPKPVASVNKPSGKYTIQHVTYVAQSVADREIQKLLKKGHHSFIIPSGRYLQVCIDSFETRQEAIKILRQLRTEGIVTSDAYVRPMQR